MASGTERRVLSWCDKLASTPTIGLAFDHHFESSAHFFQVMSPLLDKLVDGEKVKFSIENQDPLHLSLVTDEGFQYAFDPSKISVEFKHRLKARAVSGGPPILEMISRPRPFTELLPEVAKQLVDTASRLLDGHPRTLRRIGVVSTTQVAEDEAPPGIKRFIDYVARPWNGFVPAYRFETTGIIEETPGWTDRCVHLLFRQEDSDGLVTLRFDWQRVFTPVKPVVAHALSGHVDAAQTAALTYFEDLAEGNRFDEDFISQTA